MMVLLAVPAGLAQADVLTPTERAWVESHGPIRYAPDPGYPPFEQVLADGTVEGINVDLLNRISRNLDIEFETVVYASWDEVLLAMQAGEVDLLGSLAQTAERDEYMDFYGPYMELGEVFYVRSDSPYRSNAEMEGKRVAVIGSYAAATWLAENRPGIELVPVDDMRAGLEAVSAGQVDAFFENIPVTGYVIRQEGFNNIRLLDEPLYYSPANWGVGKGDAVLLSIMEKGMRSIPLGEQTAIFEFWSGYDLGVRREVNQAPTWLQPAIWALGGLLVVGTAWIVSLRRTVHNRTAEIKRVNEGLEERVAERTAALERANRHLDAFAASVTHDLQKPLTAMKMDAKVADLQLQKGTAPDFGSLQRQIERMERFIGAMLQFSRASMPDVRVDAPIEPMVREIEQVLARNGGPGCRIEVQPGLTAHADPQLLRIVLDNLIGNAWKFTQNRPDGLIQVGAEGDTYHVRDNGPGFEAAEIGQRVFEPFVRGADNHGVPGMGIGLATAARIVRVHGGRIWAESAPGHGATIYWTMPRPSDEPQ